MSAPGYLQKKTTYGTLQYGPFPDGTVQTYFRWSPPHLGSWEQEHYDLYLMKPSPGRDKVIREWHGLCRDSRS